jgi:hypothetical protein
MAGMQRSHRGDKTDARALLLRLPDDPAHPSHLVNHDQRGPSVSLHDRHVDSVHP